jgi:hypothetical protein
VSTGEYDYEQMRGWKHDAWRYKKDDFWTNNTAFHFLARIVSRDCTFAQRVQSGAHYYQQNECDTPMGRCFIAGDAAVRPLMTSDAYGIGPAMTDISPPRWSEVHAAAHPGEDWGVSAYNNLQKNPVDAPIGIPCGNVPHMRCNPDAVSLHRRPPTTMCHRYGF